MPILVVGSVALDSVKTPYGEKIEALGGSATFFSLSASYFSPVNVVAVIGEDFPKQHLALLKKRKNIDFSGLEVKKGGKTFRWKASYEADINNPKTLDTQLNVFGEFYPVIPDKYKNSRYLFLANIDPDLQHNILTQIKRPKVIACDSMNYWIRTKKQSLERLLKKVDIFFVNDNEVKMLTGCDNLFKAAKDAMNMGPKIVVVKKGEHGVLFVSKNSSFIVPAYLLDEVIDPTGAGDTFAGGFIGYIASRAELNNSVYKKAVVYGTVMASFNVESFSVDKLASLNKEQIQKRYRKFVKLTRF